MSCSSSCGPKPTCMKYMAEVIPTPSFRVQKGMTKEQKEFWDPPIDQHKLAKCTICKCTQVDYSVPRFFWSPHYDENGTVMCKCKDRKSEAMVARRI